MSRQPRVTVALCTRDRSSLLADVVAAVLRLDPPAGDWEVLIVDNRSRDDTLAVAQELADRHPGRVRVAQEPEVGLSAARNAAVRAARGEVVAFLDDDAYPVRGWLRSLLAAFDDPGVLAAGGPVDPLLQGRLPAWFRSRYLPYLTVWDRGDEAHELSYNEYPRGANMAFRRQAFERFGPFSTRLGRRGRSLLSGEETELCLRLERGGGRIVYAPEARVGHVIDAGRITPAWLARRFAAQGETEARIDWIHGGPAALAADLPRFAANAAVAHRRRVGEGDGGIHARCQRHLLAGFLIGCATAPFAVRRWHPPAGVRRRWRPAR
jgi:glucosyl-dolichyl phosphate glucuronosyltransferase